MKKNLSTCITIQKDGQEDIFNTIEEAAASLGLTKRQLEQRATRESSIKGVTYKWCDPSTRRSYLGRKSRRKGNAWECEIINRLKEIGYDGCVSARSESKRMDDAKIDIVDTNNELPCYIQAKNTANLPNYHKIEQACPLKDRPLVIACKQANKSPIVIIPIEFFYKLISKN